MRNATLIRAIEAAARAHAPPGAVIEVGRHQDFRVWDGAMQRGSYLQTTLAGGEVQRLYAPTYEDLLVLVRQQNKENKHEA